MLSHLEDIKNQDGKNTATLASIIDALIAEEAQKEIIDELTVEIMYYQKQFDEILGLLEKQENRDKIKGKFTEKSDLIVHIKSNYQDCIASGNRDTAGTLLSIKHALLRD